MRKIIFIRGIRYMLLIFVGYFMKKEGLGNVTLTRHIDDERIYMKNRIACLTSICIFWEELWVRWIVKINYCENLQRIGLIELFLLRFSNPFSAIQTGIYLEYMKMFILTRLTRIGSFGESLFLTFWSVTALKSRWNIHEAWQKPAIM